MKKIVYRYLSGFAFGVMMLVLCFLLTYSFGGQAYYQKELVQVLKPNALLVQTIWAGILYVCITITLINTHEFLKEEDNDVSVQYLLMFMIHIIMIIFVSFLAQEYGNFGLGVYSLLFGIGMIILMLGTLADMFQNLLKMMKLKRKLFVVKDVKNSEQDRTTSRTISSKATNSREVSSKRTDTKVANAKITTSRTASNKAVTNRATSNKTASNRVTNSKTTNSKTTSTRNKQ